jgi:hypothetical protein
VRKEYAGHRGRSLTRRQNAKDSIRRMRFSVVFWLVPKIPQSRQLAVSNTSDQGGAIRPRRAKTLGRALRPKSCDGSTLLGFRSFGPRPDHHAETRPG